MQYPNPFDAAIAKLQSDSFHVVVSAAAKPAAQSVVASAAAKPAAEKQRLEKFELVVDESELVFESVVEPEPVFELVVDEPVHVFKHEPVAELVFESPCVDIHSVFERVSVPVRVLKRVVVSSGVRVCGSASATTVLSRGAPGLRLPKKAQAAIRRGTVPWR